MKFERIAEAKKSQHHVWVIMQPFLILTLMVGMAIAYMSYREERAARAVYQEQSDRYETRVEELYWMNRNLEDRLDEMTKTAGAYRAYDVYHQCVQHNLGIYQMKEVARAYDRHFRSTELTRQCLSESEWYETHPHGINPAHLNH